MAGDGCARHDNKKPRYKYTTTSKELANSFEEILLKLGYISYSRKENGRNINCRDIFRIYWSEHRTDTKFEVRSHIFLGLITPAKLYCVTVPSGFIITRRNGRIANTRQ
jgi:hypothetical protein